MKNKKNTIREKMHFTGKMLICVVVALSVGILPQTSFASDGEDYTRLEERLKEVEQQLAQQAKLIEAQQQMIEKLSNISPKIKEIVTVPEAKATIDKFVLKGCNLFDPADLDPILSKYRGKDLTLKQLNNIADELTKYYRANGYVSSRVYLSTQEISDNTVEYNVIEGRVGEIIVEGNRYIKPEIIERQINLEEGEVLVYDKLNKDIRSINQQPDVTVQAVLKPGKDKGTSDIVVKPKEEERPYHLFADYSNEGTLYTTRSRFGTGFVHNNFLGNEDILTVRGRVGERIDIYSVSGNYNTPLSFLGLNKTRVGGYYAYSNSVIGDEFHVLNPMGWASAWGLYLSHPWLDVDWSEPFPLTLGSSVTAGFDSISVHNEMLGRETSNDEIRVIKAGFSIDEKDDWGRSFISENVRIGLDDFMGSMERYSPKSSRLDASSRFVKNTGDLSRITRLPFSSYLVTKLKYQITSDPLPQSEQFVIGGAGTVRGYPENEYFGDYGMCATVEARTPAFVIPGQIKVPFDESVALRDAIQFGYFIDCGKAILMKPRVGEEKDMFLVGAGFSLIWDLYKSHIKGRVDLGFPVNKTPSDVKPSRVHIGVSCQW